MDLCFCICEVDIEEWPPKVQLGRSTNVPWLEPHLTQRPKLGNNLMSVAQQTSDLLEGRPRLPMAI